MNDSGDVPSAADAAREPEPMIPAQEADSVISNEPNEPAPASPSAPAPTEVEPTVADAPTAEPAEAPGEAAPAEADPSAPEPSASSTDAPVAEAPVAEAQEGESAPPARPKPQSKPAKGKGGGKGGDRKKGSGNGRRGGGGKTAPRRPPVSSIPWSEPLALVRFGKMSTAAVFRHNIDPPPRRDTQVVIRTDRGVELGLVLTSLAPEDVTPVDPPTDPSVDAPADAPADGTSEASPETCCGHGDHDDRGGGCLVSCDRLKAMGAAGVTEYGYSRTNRILRLATSQDVNDQIHLDRTEREKMKYCAQQAVELGLKMRLATVEHLLGGERVIFYFTSDSRVDFRELVRRLASQYRTRIEMRQIGARDEARLIGDYERCGQQCCCQAFLGTLQPVSIRMAKVQKATLDPSKISGRCNRLMCCLRFEDETYEVLRKRLPKKNVWVRTEEMTAKVLSGQILTQLVRVVDVHGAMSVIDNDSIIERGVDPPDPAEARRPARRESPPPRPRRPRPTAQTQQKVAAPAGEAATAAAGGEAPAGEPKKRRRRRRRGKGGAGGSGGEAKAQAAPRTGQAGGEGQEPPKKKRRRRRRRKPSGGGEGGSGGGEGGSGGAPGGGDS